MKYDTATPRVACYVLLKKDEKVLFILRSNTGWMDGKYGLAAGRVEVGETFSEGTVREAKEEAGVTIKLNDLKYVLTIHRKAEDLDNTWVDVYFEVTTWTGVPHNAEPHMHEKVEWLDPNDLPDNMIPAISFALDQIQAGNNYAEFGWD